MNNTTLLYRLREYLTQNATGRTNAVTIGKLCYMTGAERRTIERLTEQLRDEGMPLCSAVRMEPRGMYIAQTKDEAREYTQAIWSRCKKMMRRIGLTNAALDEIETKYGKQLEMQI